MLRRSAQVEALALRCCRFALRVLAMSPTITKAIAAIVEASEDLHRAGKRVKNPNTQAAAMAVTGIAVALREGKVDAAELRAIAVQLAGWCSR
jgi:hypothetical protein